MGLPDSAESSLASYEEKRERSDMGEKVCDFLYRPPRRLTSLVDVEQHVVEVWLRSLKFSY